MFHLVTAVVLAILSVSECQVKMPGKCPNLPVVRDFNIFRYLGLWFEIERFPFFIEEGTKCGDTSTSINYADYTINIVNTRVNKTNGKLIVGKGTGTIIDRTDARWFVRFSRPPAGQYWVLATDYDKSALVWSCTDNGDGSSTALAWILSRRRTLCRKQVRRLKRLLHWNGIDTRPFKKTDQTGCDQDHYTHYN